MAKLRPLFADEKTAAQLLDMKIKEFQDLVDAGAVPPPTFIGGKHPRKTSGSLSKRAVQTRIHEIRTRIGAEKYVIHGWRYNAAQELAETGATDAEIQAVTGHRTLEMAQKYRAQAHRKSMSKEAQGRRGKSKSVKQSVKRIL